MHFKSLIYVKNPPIGIILCTSKKQEQIELLGLENSNIHVSEYLTILPPKEFLNSIYSRRYKEQKCVLSSLGLIKTAFWWFI